MADLKISQLPAATTPLAGTEVLPVVQSSTTDKVSVANLTAGRTVSMLGATITGLTASKPVFTDGSSNLTSSGTVPTTQGGTGITSFTANGLVYASSTSALTTGSALNFDGSSLGVGGAAGTFTSTIYATSATADMGVSIYSANNSGTPSVRLLNGLNSARMWLTGDGSADLNFGSPRNTTTARFQVLGSGDVKVNTGNLIQGTAAKGFDFSANTAAAGKTSTLLNWYEEGTFTPTAIGSTSAGTGTYGTQRAMYTRVGRAVSFSLNLAWSAHTGTGNLLITGLPFSVNSGASFAFSIATDSLAYSNQLVCQISGGATNIEIFQQSNNASWVSVPMDTSIGYLTITGTYFV